MKNETKDVVDVVRSKYGAVAQDGLSSDHAGVRAVAEAFGYRPEELAAIPAEANLGLSCGNPGAIAALRLGETVLDLGSGAGFDAFLCGPKVGASGRVIGVVTSRGSAAGKPTWWTVARGGTLALWRTRESFVARPGARRVSGRARPCGRGAAGSPWCGSGRRGSR